MTHYLIDIVIAVFNDVKVISIVALGDYFLASFDWAFKHCVQYCVELFSFKSNLSLVLVYKLNRVTC